MKIKRLEEAKALEKALSLEEARQKKIKDLPVVFPGYRIETNEEFQGGKGWKGIIISTCYDYYGICFDNSRGLQDKKISLNKLIKKEYVDEKDISKRKYLLKEDKGRYLSREEFDIIPLTEEKDKNKDEVISYLFSSFFETTLEKINSEKEIKDNIVLQKNEIKKMARDVKKKETAIKNAEEEIKELQNIDLEKLNPSSCIKEYERIKNHSKVLDLFSTPKYLVVKTKPLDYTNLNHKSISYKDFGAYLIFIPKDNSSIKCINYLKQVSKGSYFFPCIQICGDICTGSVLGQELKKFQDERNVLGIITDMIDFLQTPNYGHPYIPDWKFSCAQPVTINPSNLEDWLSDSYWKAHEKWNQTKFDGDRMKEEQRISNL